MSLILAIDDLPINRQFLVSLLGYGGHTVLEASSGAEGLAIVRKDHPDLIITDVKMPVMDGYEFVTELRKEPAACTTPVIFYTAWHHEREAKDQAHQQGVIEVIAKPAEPQEILIKVNAALGKVEGPRSDSSAAIMSTEVEDLQTVSLRLTALVELGIELAAERDVSQQLRRCCNGARSIIGARKAVIGIVDEHNAKLLQHCVVSGLDPSRDPVWSQPPLDHPLLRQLVDTKRPLRLDHCQPDSLRELSPNNSSIDSFLGVPLISPTQFYGWLYLLDKKGGDKFTPDDEKMAETLAAQASIAYENVVLYQRPQQSHEDLEHTRREQLELKDQFISHVSHELRSPLAAIHQFITILLDGVAGDLSSDQRQYLDIVLRNSIQLRDMISDLLDMTRADSGKLLFEQHPTSLVQLFLDLEKTYRPAAEQKGLMFLIKEPRHLPRVYADAQRLRQILSNLIENALKFTKTGKINVSAAMDDQEGFLRITVSDTGCGIKPLSIPLIFNRLYQENSETAQSRQGLGLGLHICQQLVLLHGGRLWVESHPGKGSTFLFTLPTSN